MARFRSVQWDAVEKNVDFNNWNKTQAEKLLERLKDIETYPHTKHRMQDEEKKFLDAYKRLKAIVNDWNCATPLENGSFFGSWLSGAATGAIACVRHL